MEQRRRLLGSEGTSSSTTTTLKVSLLESLGQTWSGELVALFVEDWDAQAALSCHLAPDLCQCKKRVRIALSLTLDGLRQSGECGRIWSGGLLKFRKIG